MSKVFVGVGHGGRDSGAVGYIVEKDGALVIATACNDYLQANGVETKMSRYVDEDEGLMEKINECNAYNPDLAADIHLNAGGGDGAEVFYTIKGGTGKIMAQNVLDAICELGQQSRGIKTKVNSSGKDYFGFIRLTNCPAIISEAYFVDNAEDVKIGDTVEEQKIIGQAIAKGILKTLEINSDNKTTEENKTQSNEITYSTIKRGSQGNIVKIAQEKLIAKGYALTKYGADGDFGVETELAVKALQKDAGLVVDGIIGVNTWAVLNGDFVKPNKIEYPGYLIKKGQISDDVGKIQERLIELGYSCGPMGADRDFGTNTAKAVEKFQKDNNLVPDKIVGPKTWDKLFQ